MYDGDRLPLIPKEYTVSYPATEIAFLKNPENTYLVILTPNQSISFCLILTPGTLNAINIYGCS